MEIRKHPVFKSPETSKMQEVVIDDRTRIYIPLGADAAEAKSKFQLRLAAKITTRVIKKTGDQNKS
jgi:hypothetical protein